MKTTSEASPAARPATAVPGEFRNAFEIGVRKTRRNIQALADQCPLTSWSLDPEGNYARYPESFFDIGNWTTSFFTGMALLAWQETEEDFFLQQTLLLAPLYREKVFTRSLNTHHDLGFLYSLYSVGLYRLTGGTEHRATGLRAAEVLAQRFNSRGNFIRAWGHMNTTEFDNMAIIDCLMNLPLLYWATAESGDPRFRDLAIRHADMALATFVRPDDSVYHAYRFDLATGRPLAGDTYGGCAVESHWARGAAWAIYGFALSYGHTQNAQYLTAARRLAAKFLACLDAEVVPMWDFKLTPSAPRIRDSSAGAVAVCGFQELLKHLPLDSELKTGARQLLLRLCSDAYLDRNEACPGLLKFAMVGAENKGARNAYTSWGDYYLMEALARELGSEINFW